LKQRLKSDYVPIELRGNFGNEGCFEWGEGAVGKYAQRIGNVRAKGKMEIKCPLKCPESKKQTP
jgi:hypothetical protein